MGESVDDQHLMQRGHRDRALKKSILSGAGVRVATLVIGLCTVSLSVNSLGDSGFGVVATLSTVIGIAGFADFGLGLGLMTRLAQSHGVNDLAAFKPLISSALASLSVIGVLFASLGCLSAGVLPWELVLGSSGLSESELAGCIVIFAVSVGLALPAGIGQRVLLGTQRGQVANAWSLFASVMQLVGVILSALVGAPVWVFLVATITLPVLVNGAESIWVLGRASHLKPSRHHVSKIIVRRLLHIGGLFFALNVAVALAYQSDTLVVSAVMGVSSAAVFVIAMRMFAAASGLFSASLQQFWPALAESLARGDLVWARRRFGQVLIFTTLGMTGAASLIAVFGQEIARIWVGEALVPPIALLVSFAIWVVYGQVMTQCSTLLNAAEVVRPQAISAGIMTLVNLPLSIYLTGQIGLVGPVVASLIAHILCSGSVTVIMVRKVLQGHAQTYRNSDRA